MRAAGRARRRRSSARSRTTPRRTRSTTACASGGRSCPRSPTSCGRSPRTSNSGTPCATTDHCHRPGRRTRPASAVAIDTPRTPHRWEPVPKLLIGARVVDPAHRALDSHILRLLHSSRYVEHTFDDATRRLNCGCYSSPSVASSSFTVPRFRRRSRAFTTAARTAAVVAVTISETVT